MANGHTWWKWEPGIKADRMLFSCCFWKEWLLFQQRKELRLHGAMQQVWPGCAGEKLSTWREGLALGVGFINHCIHSFNMKTGKKKGGGGSGETHISFILYLKSSKRRWAADWLQCQADLSQIQPAKELLTAQGQQRLSPALWPRGVHGTAVALLLGTQVLCLAEVPTLYLFKNRKWKILVLESILLGSI